MSFFFFVLIILRVSGNIFMDFFYQLLLFEFNLIAVKKNWCRKEALVDLLPSYHAVPGVALYFVYILSLQAGETSTSDLNHAQVIVDQSEMYTHVFYEFEDNKVLCS
jgi:hypothetical protein